MKNYITYTSDTSNKFPHSIQFHITITRYITVINSAFYKALETKKPSNCIKQNQHYQNCAKMKKKNNKKPTLQRIERDGFWREEAHQSLPSLWNPETFPAGAMIQTNQKRNKPFSSRQPNFNRVPFKKPFFSLFFPNFKIVK